jgi:hypothetical protein
MIEKWLEIHGAWNPAGDHQPTALRNIRQPADR